MIRTRAEDDWPPEIIAAYGEEMSSHEADIEEGEEEHLTE